MSAMGGEVPLADGTNRRDCLTAVSPMFKRRREPTGLRRSKLHGYIVATSADHELEPIGASRANL